MGGEHILFHLVPDDYFAGAASQLHQWAIMVNPYDIEGVSAAIHKAFYMDEKEKVNKMRKLRSFIKKRISFGG